MALALPGQEGAPKWFLDDLKKQPKSLTNTTCELRVMGTDEVLVCPVKQSTTVFEIKMFLAMKLGCDPGIMSVIMKQGCSWRAQADSEEIARKVHVKGIKSFKREKHKWPNPIAIIGTGHAGLRQAMFFIKHKEFNFVVYDRKALVGGTSWIDQANTTSKLQTELGTYHLQYDEDNPVPQNMSTWPSTEELLKHFREVSEEYGIMPYCKMCTNIKEIKIKAGTKSEQVAEMSQKGISWATQTYTLTLEPTDGTGDGRGDNIGATGAPCEDVDHSAVIMYPGNLTIPKRCELTGEDTFEGDISYAIMNDFDYSKVKGKQVAILGHGAFAVENLRTCLEYSCRQAYMICRRKNLACPRVVSWFINQSVNPISGPLTMKSFLPMYDLLGFDPWAYHSVYTNEKRTNVTINQKSRFGIGDVYFVANAMGICEVVEDEIKRISPQHVHMQSGRKLEAQVILKLYGFNGNFDVDRLMNVKSMMGFWPDEDFRRYLIAEPIGVNATNFGGTSFSPGVRVWVEFSAYFLWYPKDFPNVRDSGLMPTHSADPELDRPAYVIDARHGTQTIMGINGAVPAIAEAHAGLGLVKRQKQLECHPTRKYLEECRLEWEEYGEKLKELGAPKPCPPYPYTLKIVEAFMKENEDDALAKMSR
ncbi:unnamed protein product [Symbiodinium natans]|uniref:FAD/NAD(P)-binding domain-containing protein n=1 Tax=Symbiodinium natans TaxID=878477 RepID=A0A812TZI1_9DINO|nr:unnamed protein product [Symbiodinium natans]